MDKYIDKTILVNLPNTKRPQYRWIVSKRDDGRYIVRTPKIGVKLRELNLHRNNDYGNETLLPLKSIPFFQKRMRTTKQKFKKNQKINKTIKKMLLFK